MYRLNEKDAFGDLTGAPRTERGVCKDQKQEMNAMTERPIKTYPGVPYPMGVSAASNGRVNFAADLHTKDECGVLLYLKGRSAPVRLPFYRGKKVGNIYCLQAEGLAGREFRYNFYAGDEILTFAPFFPEYRPYVEGAGDVLKVVPADTETFQIHFEAFEELLSEKTAAVLINSPNNPSGIVYSEETLRRLADLLRQKQEKYGHDIFLISDEPYREIVFDGKTAPYVSSLYENTISCYSFSKSLSLPGERIGYVAVNPACREAETIVNMCGQISRGTGHNCPPSLIQLAVAEVIDRTADLSVYETNRNLLYDGLRGLGFTCVRPGGTFYIFPKALEEDANVFCQKALAYDLILVPGDTFGCPGYFRMAYCIDTEKVVRSLDALERFVRTEYGRQGQD